MTSIHIARSELLHTSGEITPPQITLDIQNDNLIQLNDILADILTAQERENNEKS